MPVDHACRQMHVYRVCSQRHHGRTAYVSDQVSLYSLDIACLLFLCSSSSSSDRSAKALYRFLIRRRHKAHYPSDVWRSIPCGDASPI